ncbi:serine/threonine-protein kinase [Gordonia malaquae]|jgi:serine/threonine protein kinase|uniref:serine/threonine-protein kinase n=1 Tax=Gordonia malaquae TaxID=410332 RepID=UPI0030166F1A
MSSSADRSGTELGPYRLVRLIGRGGMGEVYEAVDSVKDRTVALKLLPPHLADDDQFRARFLRESQTVARLNDPHVIPIHDFGEIDGLLYLDMRIVHGRDLRSLIKDAPLPAERAVALIAQIAGALDAAHASGLLHRDVKPENILVDSNDFAYLVDFGIAQSADATRFTATGSAIGSFAYMAPERFSDDIALTPASDVYSLACVLFEAVTGAPPYPSTSYEKIITGHLTRPIPPTGTVLDPVIAAGTAKDPSQRIASCGEFAAAAKAALDGRHTPTLVAPVHAPQPSPAMPYQQVVHPTPQPAPASNGARVALIAAAVAVVALIAGAGAVWMAMKTSDTDPVAASPTSVTVSTTTISASTATATATTVTETTTRPAPTRGSGDLGLSTPITVPACDGQSILIVYNATTPGQYEQEIGAALAANPGAKYLRTDNSCSSMRQAYDDGSPIYAVYFEGSSVAATCAKKASFGGASYARFLDATTPVGTEIC